MYKVGTLYSQGKTSWTENIEFNYRSNALELRIFSARLKDRDIDAIQEGPCQFAFTVIDEIIFFLCEFAFLSLSDSPYSIHMVPAEERTIPPTLSKGQQAVLNIFLISAEDGILRAMRRVSLEHTFSKALFTAILKQAMLPFDQSIYDQKLADTYRKYKEPAALFQQAIATCTIHSKEQVVEEVRSVPPRESYKGKKGKLLIEKYLTYLRISSEHAIAELKRQYPVDLEEIARIQLYADMYAYMATGALKYRVDESGKMMIEALRPRPLIREDIDLAEMEEIGAGRRKLDPDIPTPLLNVPTTAIWIELESPIQTVNGSIYGVFLCCTQRERERRLEEGKDAQYVQDILSSHTKGEYYWLLNFIGEGGVSTTFYEYHENNQRWKLLDSWHCPTEECRIDEQGDTIPCAFCSVCLGYWRSWLVTALLVVQGAFAESVEAEWPVRQETATRKTKRPHSGKFDEVLVHHDYYIVKFDASTRKVQHSQDQEPVARGSWVKLHLEIDPEAVIYVRHNFDKGSRTLDPARNSRWKEKKVVEVKAHSKRMPMLVANLQKRLTYVIASRYK